jgi:hypothetical protein
MASSATETTALLTRTAELSTVKLTSNHGPYKELAPIGYARDVEEEGKNGFQAAKVCSTQFPKSGVAAFLAIQQSLSNARRKRKLKPI